MNTGIQFATVYSSRQQGVVIADNGATVTVRPWINPTQRFAGYTWEVSKKWIKRNIPLSPLQIAKLAEIK